MSVLSGINIDIAPDGSSAVIRELPCQLPDGSVLDVESVLELLAAQKVVHGIDRSAIEEAVAKALSSFAPVRDVPAASVVQHNSIKSFVNNKVIDHKEFAAEVNSFRDTFDLVNADEFAPGNSACWIVPNTLIFEIRFADEVDVLGQKKSIPPLPFELQPSRGVVCDKQVKTIRYISDDSGFLAVDAKNNIQLLSPFVISDDQMSINLKLPQVSDPAMVEQVKQYVSEVFDTVIIAECRVLTLDDVLNKIDQFYAGQEDRLVLEVARGQESTAGIPGYIEFMVNLSGRPEEDEKGNIKFTEFTSYCMVEQGQPLLKIVHPIQGKPGINVVGDLVACEQLEDPIIDISDTVMVVDHETERLFTSLDNGCLIYKNNKIDVTDSIVVSGNVGPESGSIKKGATSVIVKGNVLSGYYIESEGDVIVEGSIENGAKIHCRDLSVYKGVFGSKSDIYITGNAEVGYIHGSKMRVLGNIKVLRYVMESEITCRSNFEVIGQGVSGSERGALIGGNTSVLGSALLHSIGSGAEITRISCGIDTYLYDKLILCRNAVTALNAEVARIQNSVGFTLGGENAVEILKAMPDEQKKAVGKKLEKIKMLLSQVASYEQQCRKVEAVALARDIKQSTIRVDRHVIPLTYFSVGINQLEIRTKLKAISVRLRNNEVVAEAV